MKEMFFIDLCDGGEPMVMTGSGEEQRRYPEMFPAMCEIPIEAGSELTITIEGNEKIWMLGIGR
ncbi:hypothetical protein CFI03_008615 [Paenibacillus sp. ATY16]|nr:hypothetical protein [Paenibacillus sp. ATY16]